MFCVEILVMKPYIWYKLLYTNKAHNSQAAMSVKENSSDDHVIIKLKVHGDWCAAH